MGRPMVTLRLCDGLIRRPQGPTQHKSDLRFDTRLQEQIVAMGWCSRWNMLAVR